MMRALTYCVTEAAASLWRGRRSAAFAMLTIAAGLFVLGFFLMVNTNLQRVLARWSEAAELSIYLAEDATPDDMKAVDELVESSGLAAGRQLVSKEQAAARFQQDFPDLAPAAAALEANPFPASIEVRLKPDVRASAEAVDSLAAALGQARGVADVRYDRRLLERLGAAIRFVRGVGLLIVVMIAGAAALTVANVVRLTAYARREEIEIMQLVGAPLVFVRGPFVMEGVLQGGIGAVVALIALWALYLGGKARYGTAVAEALGVGALSFLPAEQWFLLIAGGMILGCMGGLVVARGVR